jgi:hypothetical protein
MVTIYFEKEKFSLVVELLNKYKKIDILKDCDESEKSLEFEWCELSREERLLEYLDNIKNTEEEYISIYIDNNKFNGYDFGKSNRYNLYIIYYLKYFDDIRVEKIKRLLNNNYLCKNNKDEKEEKK